MISMFLIAFALNIGCASKVKPVAIDPRGYIGLDGEPVKPTRSLERYTKAGVPVEGLYVIEGRPPELLLNDRTSDNRQRLTVWRMQNDTLPKGEVFFRSLVFCTNGIPRSGEPKAQCGQYYFGVKVDGSETLALQQRRPNAWVIVLTPSEQSALRITGVCADPSPYDMGGC
jgi:hypothetical protein